MVPQQLAAVFSKLQTLSTSDHASVVSMNLFVELLCAYVVIGHLLEENRWMNESITALVIVKKKQFFRNFITIMLFGAVVLPRSVLLVVIATLMLQTGVIQFFQEMDIGSLDIGDFLAIGAIFAATDSVCTLQVLNQDETPLLYSLVFGEGVVNDATSVVLFIVFNAIQSFDLNNINPRIALEFIGSFLYLFLASTLLGLVVGLVSAYIIKKLYFGGHSTDREFALMMLMACLSYIMAELFYLSGILTVFFCGIVMSHYTWHNITESSRVTTKHAFATLSFVAEIFIFLYVGMDALDLEKWRFVNDSPGISVAVSSLLLALVMAGRAAFVFPFTRAGHTQLRGNAIMITNTITVVLFSTVVRCLLPSFYRLRDLMFSSSPDNAEHTPETIEANRTDEFKYFADGQGSYGGVAYKVVNGGKWIVAWKDLLNVNKAYTKILNPGEEFYWDVIFSNLEKANSHKSCENNPGLSASVVIDITGGYQHLQQYSNLLLNKWLCSMHLHTSNLWS
ncbi:hypothetical protein CRYUN_Cryun05aG0037700 [Craigia yunnanensis]